ncbi:MAG: site-specific integrase [Oscillibacter sp.]|nr:site-specific integrase [Oscillibacter sp.]
MAKPKTRPNGSGTAFRRGKYWCCQVVTGWFIGDDGKSRKITRSKSGFHTKTAALAYAETLRAEQCTKATSLEKLYQVWKQGRYEKLSESRQCAYRIAHEKCKPILSKIISDIDIGNLQDLIAGLTYYPAKDIKQLLSMLYDMAIAQGNATVNLAKYMDLPQLDETEQIPFNDDEIKSLWADYYSGNTFTGYLLLMIYSGMMPGELLQLKKDMIQWGKQEIINCGLKTKKRKRTPIVIADQIIPVLHDLCDKSKSRIGKVLCQNKDSFYEEYYQTLERTGCRRLPPYSCRHTTASALALGNIAPSIIQEVMRHAKFSTTQRYIHIDAAPSLAAVNTLQAGCETEAQENTPNATPNNSSSNG